MTEKQNIRPNRLSVSRQCGEVYHDKEDRQLIEVPRIKRAYAEPFTEWREDNAETVESRDTVFAVRV